MPMTVAIITRRYQYDDDRINYLTVVEYLIVHMSMHE